MSTHPRGRGRPRAERRAGKGDVPKLASVETIERLRAALRLLDGDHNIGSEEARELVCAALWPAIPEEHQP
jgi:hypothetical protein